MVGKNAISAKNCEIIISEIKKTKVFDDLIQGGRNRINKGSKNFKDFLIGDLNKDGKMSLYESKR